METIEAEKMMEILQKHGTTVSIKQAQLILKFMYKLATISLKIYVEQ